MLSRRIAVPLSFAVMSVEYWLIVKVSTLMDLAPLTATSPKFLMTAHKMNLKRILLGTVDKRYYKR